MFYNLSKRNKFSFISTRHTPTNMVDVEGDDEDLYGDLEEVGTLAEKAHFQSLVDSCQRDLVNNTKVVEELKAALTQVVYEKDRVEKNAVVVFATAVRELSRKDRDIVDLKVKIQQIKEDRS